MRYLLPLLLSAVAGCAYTEDALEHFDIPVKVKIPKELVSFPMSNDEGESWVIEGDPRSIGPVWLGSFPGVKDDLFDFPHPEIGPVLSAAGEANTYPYGGTSVGRPDFGCYQQLLCKIVTGRYSSYDDAIEFFRDEVRQPITNQFGEEVTSGIEFRERCYEIMYLTSDEEVAFVDDGKVDFEDMGDHFEAQGTLWHSYWREGAVAWGWMDAPSQSFNFGSCDANQDAQAGWQVFYYDEQYYTGQVPVNLLNFPSRYIQLGDLIVEDAPEITDPTKEVTVDITFKYE
jgi:hypothetical protein